MNIEDTIVYKKLVAYRGLYDCSECGIIPVSQIDTHKAVIDMAVSNTPLTCKCGAAICRIPPENMHVDARPEWC